MTRTSGNWGWRHVVWLPLPRSLFSMNPAHRKSCFNWRFLRGIQPPGVNTHEAAWSQSLSGGGRHEAPQGRLVLDLAEHGRKTFEALEIVDGHEFVDVGHGGAHALSERLVAGSAEEGVEPDQAAAGALQ